MVQGIVFEVCIRVGICPGVQRAMEAMCAQLICAFKLEGTLGSSWKATNGILQGCPLSVVLVNALMGVWRAEIDSLRPCGGDHQGPAASTST